MQVATMERAESVPVSNETRGHAIRARRLAHGIKSVREFAEETGVSREAITAAEDGSASDRTYDRLEAWLDNFEEEVGANQPADPQLVTFKLSGNFGVDVVLSGPVENIDQLRETVEKLIRGMGDRS